MDPWRWKKPFARGLVAIMLVTGVAHAVAPPGRYNTDLNFRVGDRTTLLEWEESLEPSSFTWDEANTYCDERSSWGTTDWRLPTAPELESLLDVRETPPYMDQDVFGTVPVANFWSSTTHPSDSSKAYAVGTGNDANSGGVFSKTTKLRVRCVRAG